MRRPTRRFRPVLECLEDRLNPSSSSFTATIMGTTLTIAKSPLTAGTGSALDITPAATFGELTVATTGGDTIAGGASFTTPKAVTTVVVNLGASASGDPDTLVFTGTPAAPINLTGGLTITGTGGDKVLELTDVNLLNAAALKVNLTGAGTETSLFTNVNVGGAATFTHPGVAKASANVAITITSTVANPGPSNWGSLSITNGAGDDANVIHDTHFAGNVSISDGATDGTTGSTTTIDALNDTTLTTIGGNVSIGYASGLSNTTLDDYDVHGTVTINTGAVIAGQTGSNFVGVENQQTVSTSGIPTIGGNVSITGATAPDSIAPTGLTIDVGTSSVPLILHGNLTVSATGTEDKNTLVVGTVAVNLTDLLIASGTTSVTLGKQTSGNTVTIDGANAVSDYGGGLSITSNSAGGDTYNIQNMAGQTDFGGSVSLSLGSNTTNGFNTVLFGHAPAPLAAEDGTVNIAGNLSIAATDGDNKITVLGTRLSGTGKLNVSLLGSQGGTNDVTTFTDTAVAGAATFNHPEPVGAGVGVSWTINTSGSPSANTVYKWGSLSITTGEGPVSTAISDVDFAGNVTINNTCTNDADATSSTTISATNDRNLATIGGNVTINNQYGPSNSFLDDYNVQGSVTINSGLPLGGTLFGAPNLVGLENMQAFANSGIPVIGGNVAITAATDPVPHGAAAPLAIVDIGTGGTNGTTAENNPLVIEGNLAITATGIVTPFGPGSALVNLNDLSVPNGTTSVTLGAKTAGDIVQVQGSSSVTSVFDNFNITSTASSTTVSIQDQAGTLVFGGAVNIKVGGGGTLNLAADTNNTSGVAGAVVDLFGTSAFDGGTPDSTEFGEANGTFNTNLFFFTTPQFKNF